MTNIVPAPPTDPLKALDGSRRWGIREAHVWFPYDRFEFQKSLLRKLVGLLRETGWPSKGDSKEPYATVDNADTYNSNLIKYIFDRSRIPFHHEYTSSVYIYELFNEDLRSSLVFEANWGLFYANLTHVYLLHVSGN
ncbi:glucan endo-1,3-beta-glucosidase 1, partial [Tanacetum coccineum]